jgi:hypothetical protein
VCPQRTTALTRHNLLQLYILYGTYLGTITHHVINFLRTRVSSLTQSLDKLGFRLITIVNFGKGQCLVDSTLQLQEFRNHTERLVARVNSSGRNGSVGGTKVTILVRDLAFRVLFQFSHRHQRVRLLVVALEVGDDLLTGRRVQFVGARQENGDIFERWSGLGDSRHLFARFQHVGIVFQDGNPALDSFQLTGSGQSTGRRRLNEFQLVQQSTVPGTARQETLIGKLGVVDKGDDFGEFKGRLFVID